MSDEKKRGEGAGGIPLSEVQDALAASLDALYVSVTQQREPLKAYLK